MRLKKWDFYGIVTKDIVVSMAMANLGYTGNIYVHIYDRNKKNITKFDKILTPF